MFDIVLTKKGAEREFNENWQWNKESISSRQVALLLTCLRYTVHMWSHTHRWSVYDEAAAATSTSSSLAIINNNNDNNNNYNTVVVTMLLLLALCLPGHHVVFDGDGDIDKVVPAIIVGDDITTVV